MLVTRTLAIGTFVQGRKATLLKTLEPFATVCVSAVHMLYICPGRELESCGI